MQTTLANPSNNQHRRTVFFKQTVKYMREFITKFNNDWMMNSASGLAYSLMVAVVPIAVSLFFVLGLTLGRLNPAIQAQLVQSIEHIFPSGTASGNVLEPALVSLRKNAGFLGVLVALGSIFGGSRLFISIEGYFDIIYRTYPRKVIAQNVMAILMMLVFILLTPLMFFASSVPAFMLTLAHDSTLARIPEVAQLTQNGFLLSAAGVSGSLFVCWILLEAIYLVIPNQKIDFKKSWPGAVTGAILLQLFLFLFPFYIAHFMGSYQGDAGFVIVLLVFFYYFAVILLLGAEINAYFAEKIPPLRNNLAVLIHDISVNENSVPASADSQVVEKSTEASKEETEPASALVRESVDTSEEEASTPVIESESKGENLAKRP